MPWAVTASASCCSSRVRAAASAHTRIISASVGDMLQKKLRPWRKEQSLHQWLCKKTKKKAHICLIQQNDGTKSQQRWDGVVSTAAVFKRRGVALLGRCESYSAETVFVFLFFFYLWWECPHCYCIQSKAHLYIQCYGLRNHANSVDVV